MTQALAYFGPSEHRDWSDCEAKCVAMPGCETVAVNCDTRECVLYGDMGADDDVIEEDVEQAFSICNHRWFVGTRKMGHLKDILTSE